MTINKQCAINAYQYNFNFTKPIFVFITIFLQKIFINRIFNTEEFLKRCSCSWSIITVVMHVWQYVVFFKANRYSFKQKNYLLKRFLFLFINFIFKTISGFSWFEKPQRLVSRSLFYTYFFIYHFSHFQRFGQLITINITFTYLSTLVVKKYQENFTLTLNNYIVLKLKIWVYYITYGIGMISVYRLYYFRHTVYFLWLFRSTI